MLWTPRSRRAGRARSGQGRNSSRKREPTCLGQSEIHLIFTPHWSYLDGLPRHHLCLACGRGHSFLGPLLTACFTLLLRPSLQL